jgi:hypothetical protein
MVVAAFSPSPADWPAEMVAAVAREAAQDAQRVDWFLTALGHGAVPQQPRFLPPRFLLALGTALRLLAWEKQGFFFHQDLGLPSAQQSIRDAFRTLTDPQIDPTDVCLTVLRLFVERFAWLAGQALQAPVAVDDLAEDQALDALAEYLWVHRPAAGGSDAPAN